MLQGVKNHIGSCLRSVAVLVGIMVLTGCASTLSARVTSYEQWPADAQGQTYQIVPSAVQANNLQYQSFSDMVRAAIGPTGLVEATRDVKARFNITLEYDNPMTQVWVQEYADPYFGNGFGPMFGGYYGGRRGWYSGFYFAPAVVNVPVQMYKNTLTIVIKDNLRHGAEVYRSTAVSVTSGDNLLAVMPYLSRAVFDGFPGNNGRVRDITYEVKR